MVVMSLGVAQVEFNLPSNRWVSSPAGKVKTWINKTFKCKGADDQSIITLVITHDLDLMWVVEKFTPAKTDFIEVKDGTVFEGLEMPSKQKAQELVMQFFKLHCQTHSLPSIPSVNRELRRRTRSSFLRPRRRRPDAGISTAACCAAAASADAAAALLTTSAPPVQPPPSLPFMVGFPRMAHHTSRRHQF